MGKNVEVNVTPKISHQSTITQAQKPDITYVLTQHKSQLSAHELAKKSTHEDEKIDLVLSLAGGFTIWNIFRRNDKTLDWAKLIITQKSDVC